nr:Glutamyl-tRNA(Gln) amidotransferase subunit D like [Ipomoea batatas]
MLSSNQISRIPSFLFIFIILLSPFGLASVIPGVVDGSNNGAVSWGNGRSLLQDNNGGDSSLILAAERTHRKDPSDKLNYYTGGWNISNDHYKSSVAFTGAPLFLIAAIWFLGFGLALLLVCLCCCCCGKTRYGYSRSAYALSLAFLALFTIAAIIGSAVLYTGQDKFYHSTKDTMDFVVAQADSTVYKLRNVSGVLAVAKSTGVAQIFLPKDVQNSIDRVDDTINSSANTLETETRNNKRDILRAIDVVSQTLIVLAAVMLGLAALGFLLSILGLQFLVYILVILGWILIAATFFLSGIFLVLHNVVGDTCVAMDQWVKHPEAHTALDDIIPCVDPQAARAALSQSKDVTFQMVGVVNRIINNVSNINMPARSPAWYNQSGPFVPNLCNPFNSDKTDRTCAAGEVEFSNATEVWKSYVCKVSAKNVCTTVGRLTPDLYRQMNTAVNISGGLYHYGPFLAELVDCTFLRGTFNVIHDDHCPDLSKFSKWVYIGLALASAAVMFSLIFWVIYARERRHRKYTKLVDARSGLGSPSQSQSK